MAKKVTKATAAHGRSNPRQRVHPALPGRIAAPGKKHQPTTESGKGTPSADARPGSSSVAGPLDEEEAELLRRHREKTGRRVKVQATRLGYYDNKRRHPGDVFYIDGAKHEEDVRDPETKKLRHRKGDIIELASWMRLVPARTPLGQTTAQESVNRKHDEILAGQFAEKNADADGAGEELHEERVGGARDDDDPLGAGGESGARE